MNITNIPINGSEYHLHYTAPEFTNNIINKNKVGECHQGIIIMLMVMLLIVSITHIHQLIKTTRMELVTVTNIDGVAMCQ